MNRADETVEPMTAGLIVSIVLSALIVTLLAPPALGGAAGRAVGDGDTTGTTIQAPERRGAAPSVELTPRATPAASDRSSSPERTQPRGGIHDDDERRRQPRNGE